MHPLLIPYSSHLSHVSRETGEVGPTHVLSRATGKCGAGNLGPTETLSPCSPRDLEACFLQKMQRYLGVLPDTHKLLGYRSIFKYLAMRGPSRLFFLVRLFPLESFFSLSLLFSLLTSRCEEFWCVCCHLHGFTFSSFGKLAGLTRSIGARVPAREKRAREEGPPGKRQPTYYGKLTLLFRPRHPVSSSLS